MFNFDFSCLEVEDNIAESLNPPLPSIPRSPAPSLLPSFKSTVSPQSKISLLTKNVCEIKKQEPVPVENEQTLNIRLCISSCLSEFGSLAPSLSNYNITDLLHRQKSKITSVYPFLIAIVKSIISTPFCVNVELIDDKSKICATIHCLVVHEFAININSILIIKEVTVINDLFPKLIINLNNIVLVKNDEDFDFNDNSDYSMLKMTSSMAPNYN
ncbi:hypothetical protein RCL1_001896 [Eukaryota sp. TZLM3-RCL]